MQSNLYISDGYIQRRTQRTNKLLRLAGAAVLVALVVQLAAVGGYFYLNHLQDDEDTRAAVASSAKTAIEEKLKPFSDVQAKYAQIMGWIPLLEKRVPVSSVVSYVQANLPPVYALRDLVLRSDDLITTASGFRRPKSYVLDMTGFVQPGANKGEKEILDDMRAMFPELPVKALSLPPGSESSVPALWRVVVTIDPNFEGAADPALTPMPTPTPVVVKLPPGTPGVPGARVPAVKPVVPVVAVVRPAVKKRKVVLNLFHVTETPADELPGEQQ